MHEDIKIYILEFIYWSLSYLDKFRTKIKLGEKLRLKGNNPCDSNHNDEFVIYEIFIRHKKLFYDLSLNN